MKSRGKYRRALLKLSGEALAAEGTRGFDEGQIAWLVGELASAHRVCRELAIVVGGGNIMRGAKFRPSGVGRIRADYAGMVATVVNALALQDGLERADIPCAVYSALPVEGVAQPFCLDSCLADLSRGRVLILAGGTGNPLFTTDTAAALRAIELQSEALLKATRVDGVYSADPERTRRAKLFKRLRYDEVLARELGVMDLCAVSLCMEHSLPVRVFNYKVKGNIRRALMGQDIGTLIS